MSSLQSLSDNLNREDAIEKWMLAIIDDGGIERLDHLHIDKIDSSWKNRDNWVEGGLEALRVAIVLRDRNQLPFAVALTFSLKSGDLPIGVDFRTRSEFVERLDCSPPSLYLFRRGDARRTQVGPGVAVQELSPLTLGIPKAGVSGYYLEFLPQDSEEYRRSVFIEG
jgi:hypothetical protein